MKNLALILSMATLLASCGGGSTASGAAPGVTTQPNQVAALVAEIGSANNVVGQDTFTLAAMWDNIALKGFERSGSLASFWYQQFTSVPITLTSLGPGDAANTTRLGVQHIASATHSGDSVKITMPAGDLFGIKHADLSRSFDVIPVSADRYEILVPGTATSGFSVPVLATLEYRYKECSGQQQLIQGKLIKNDIYPNGTTAPAISFNSVKASRIEQVVRTQLQGCSPASSEVLTTKYFPYEEQTQGGVRHPLLGQVVKGGDYSIVDSFTLPPTSLTSDPKAASSKGAVAVVQNFSDSTRRNRTGRSNMRYEVLQHTAQSVFVAIITETYDSSGFKYLDMTDYYAKVPSQLGDTYSLVRTITKYNNPRKTEVVINYTSGNVAN